MTAEIIVDERTLKEHFAQCKDVVIMPATIYSDERKPLSLIFVYCEELCDTKLLKEFIFPTITRMGQQYPLYSVTDIGKYKQMPLHLVGKSISTQQLDFIIFNGDLIIYFVEAEAMYSISLANPPNRNPEEPNTEMSIRGPKASISYKIKDGHPVFTVEVQATGSIVELRERMSEKQIVEYASKTVEKEIKNLFELGVKEGVDTLQLSNALYRQNVNDWRKYTTNGVVPLQKIRYNVSMSN